MEKQTNGTNDHRGATVVVGVDGSPDALAALAWAVQEAELRQADLAVIHANFIRTAAEPEHPRFFEKERQVLECALEEARRRGPGLCITGQMAEPPAAKALIEASKTAALLVVGSRGLGGIKEFMLGSVSSLCVRQAHCPVVVVRPPTS